MASKFQGPMVPRRRTARVRLNPSLLLSLLALPEGYEVIAVEAANDPVGINLIVQSDDLPEVDHDAQSPNAYLFVEPVQLDDDRTFLRVASIEVPR